jgi:hypothetical protein
MISNGLPEYLESLPTARRAEFDRLRALTAAVGAPESIASFVFLPNQAGHPLFEDAAEVFWKAVEQLYLKDAATDGELPLLYWGFHSYDLLARRSSNGVLVTDRTVYVVDVGRTSARLPLAGLDPATVRVAGDTLWIGDAGVGLAQAARLFGEASAEDSASFLRAIVEVLQPRIEASADAAPASTVDELVRASRLSDDFLLPSRPKDAKRLAKLAAKWQLPAGETLQVSLSSATLAGIYGLALTDSALYSRDLMEPLDRTALGDIEGIEWVAEKKAFRVAEGHFVPVLPAVTDDNREYFVTLLGSLIAARG